MSDESSRPEPSEDASEESVSPEEFEELTAHGFLGNDKAAAAFLERLSQLSPRDWRRIGLRRKDTKVYATAIADVERLKKAYPYRSAVWSQRRAEAITIVNRRAPKTIVLEGRGIVRGPQQFADAAADAVGALTILYPWGESFNRLYGPFSDVIPRNSLDPRPRPEAAADSGTLEPVSASQQIGSLSSATKASTSGARSLVDYLAPFMFLWVSLAALGFAALATLTGIWEFWIVTAVIVLLPRSLQVLVGDYPGSGRRRRK